MPITRLQIETLLVGADAVSGRAGRIAVKARLYAAANVTVGAIASLADPIGEALRSLAVYAADPTDPTDDDLAVVESTDFGQLVDVAELRLLESCLGNWDRWDETAGADSQAQGKLGELLQKRIDELRKKLLALYGYGDRAFGVGVLGLDFQEPDDPTLDWPPNHA